MDEGRGSIRTPIGRFGLYESSVQRGYKQNRYLQITPTRSAIDT